MHNAAIIGVSGYGKTHLDLLLDQYAKKKLKIVAAVVMNAEDEKDVCLMLKQLGCRIFNSVPEMFNVMAGKIDLCLIPAPIQFHAEFAIAALGAGANVLVEKPAAATLGEVFRIQRAAREADRFVAVGFQDIYSAETEMLKTLILEGEIGRVRRARGWGFWPRPRAYYQRNRWAGRLRLEQRWVLDSPLNNALAHYLNLMLYLANDSSESSVVPTAVEGELYRSQPIESFDTASIRVSTEAGVPVSFATTHSCSRAGGPGFVIEGTKGKIHWEFEKSCIILNRSPTKISLPATREVRFKMMDRVVERLDKGEGRICTLELAVTHTLCINALHAGLPIHSVGKEWVEQCREKDGTSQIVIRDVEQRIRKCFTERCFLSESVCPWAAFPSALTIPEGFDGIKE